MIQIDLNKFSEQFRAKVFSDYTSLQILSNLKLENDYLKNDQIIQSGIISMKFNPPPLNYLTHRETLKCFKSIMGSLQEYIDNLIAAIELSKKNISTKGIASETQLAERVNSLYKKQLMSVSTNNRLNVHEKLNYLLWSSPENLDDNNVKIKNSIQSLFDVRNGIEHHKALASKDRKLHYKRIAIVTSSGQEMRGSGTTKIGEGLFMSLVNEEINYNKGDQIIFTINQLKDIILSLIIYVNEVLKEEARKLIDENKNTPNSRLAPPRRDNFVTMIYLKIKNFIFK